MSKEQNTKIELKSKKNEDASSSQKPKSSMSFDMYFQKVLATKPNVFPHHKAAMQKYAEQKGLTEADEHDFDEIFRVY